MNLCTSYSMSLSSGANWQATERLRAATAGRTAYLNASRSWSHVHTFATKTVTSTRMCIVDAFHDDWTQYDSAAPLAAAVLANNNVDASAPPECGSYLQFFFFQATHKAALEAHATCATTTWWLNPPRARLTAHASRNSHCEYPGSELRAR